MSRINLGKVMHQILESTKLENRRARFKRYYYSHLDEMRTRKTRYYEENKEIIRTKNREYYRRTRLITNVSAPTAGKAMA